MRYRRLVTRVVVIFCTVRPLPSDGQPPIIFDNGQTRPLSNHPKPRHYTATLSIPARMNLNVNHPVDPLPIKTPGMSPGAIQSRPIDRSTLNRPVFVVGADSLSLQWLIDHRRQLAKLKAIGIAVNVDNKTQLKALRQAGAGLEIHPLSGETIARHLALQHYPVLITATRIEQ